MPYLGNSHIAGDQINNFKVLDDISSHTSTFDGSASGVVSISDNTIRIPEHRFVQGQRVTYNNGGGGNIGNLSSGTAYYIIKDTNNTIKLATSLSNANNSTAINLSVLGSGSSHTLNVAFDGVNTKFKITHNGGTSGRINNATQLSLAINNVIQRPNQNAITFTEGFAIEDQHKIVFKVAPVSSDIFWGSILANTLPTFDITDNKIDNFTGDGSTTEFNLSNIPASNKSIMVTINGVLQHPSDGSTSRSYTLLANILQFTAAPGNGDEIQVRHIGFAGASTSDVTGFYGRTGNVVLTSNDHITTGNINAGVVTATTFVGNLTGNVSGNLTVGGVLTYEDVTNVDSIGIITARSGFKVLAGGANVVGVITARTNIHLEDYIHHLGDLTTKIGFPSANNITFETAGSERLRITSGNIGIGTDNPSEKLDIISGTNSQTLRIWSKGSSSSSSLMLRTGDSGGAFIKFGDNTDNDIGQIHYSNSQEAMRFVVNTQERLRINSTGQLLHGHSASIGYGRNFETSSTSGYGGIAINRFSNDGGSGGLDFVKSRNASLGGNTIVQSDDNLGAITWRGADGTDFTTPAAQIKVAVDGTPGENDMPGRIMFYTTADGASSVSEKLRIASDGMITLGNPTNTVLKAEVCNSVSGHYFVSQCDDNNNGFEIYQQHGSTASRNTLAVYDNRTGAKSASFLVRGDGVITGRGELRLTEGTSSVSNGSEIGSLMYTYPSNDNKNAKIVALSNGGSSGADLAFFTRTQGDATNNDGGEERLRITSTGAINLTSENTTGWQLDAGDNSASYTAIDNHFPTTNRTLYINNETTHRSFVVWNKNGSDGYGFGLDNSGNFKVVYGSTERLRIASDGNLSIPGNSATKDITYGDGSTTGYFRTITNVNRASSEQSIHMQQFKWNNTKVAEIKVLTGDDTTNKDNAHIVFETANAGTTAERFRIKSDGTSYVLGDFGVGTNSPQSAGLTVENSSEARLRVRAGSSASNGEVALRADGVNTQMGTWSDHDCKLVRNSTIQASISSNGISFPSGKGLDFSATGDGSGTMDNELLDDYEEGSFTPVYYFNGTTSGVTQPSGNKLGRYTKIGNRVLFNLWITGTTDTSVSGPFQIGGLPYNTASGGAQYAAFSSWVYAGFTNAYQIIFRSNPASDRIEVQRAGASVYASEMGGTANYMIAGHYMTS